MRYQARGSPGFNRPFSGDTPTALVAKKKVGIPVDQVTRVPDLSAGQCFDHYLPDLWYPDSDTSENGRDDIPLMEKAAKRICADCSVRVECLQWAFSNEKHGIWGGYTAEERRTFKEAGYAVRRLAQRRAKREATLPQMQ